MNTTKKELRKYNKIALTGMMGSGKSTVAQALKAFFREYSVYELDMEFEKKEGISIKDFFREFGEKKFRELEEDMLEKFSQKNNFILSTGGGIVLSERNREILFQKDILTIYLFATSDTIYDRIKNDTSRPLLLTKDPKDEIKKILSKREELYELSDMKVVTEGKTPDEIAFEIYKRIENGLN